MVLLTFCQTAGHALQGKPAKEKVTRPSPRVNAILVANPFVEGEFVLFGGERFDGNKCVFFDDTLLFDEKNSSWTLLNLSIKPSPRSAHQAVTLPNGQLFMFGGEFGSSKETKFLHFSDTWLFDFGSYAWRALNLRDHPPSRSGHRLARHGRYIFLFGGYFDTGNQARYLDDLWIFDSEANTWQRVDWMNEYESRPCARSGFTFVSHPEGLLLYSGYAQLKNKAGSLQGQVMNDIWLLRFDGVDLKSLRWKKLKLTTNAPVPRSGSTSVTLGDKLYNFGGVIDEEISEEFLMGTCVNDLFEFNLTSGAWSRADLAPPIESFCGRLNAMLAASSCKIILFGGIYEVGDRQFTLDDVYRIDPKTNSIAQLQSMSPSLIGCWNLKPQPESESEGDSLDSSDQSETSGESEEDASVDEHGAPLPHRYASLKDFFDKHAQYWMDQARERNVNEEITDKKLRSAAFALANQAWEDSKILEKDISLNQ